MTFDFFSFITGLSIGLFLGCLIAYFIGNRHTTQITFKLIVGMGVFIVWILAALLSIITRGQYEMPLVFHGIFGGIVTALWGDETLRGAADKIIKK